MKKIKQAESRFNAKERVAAYQELVNGEYGLNSRLLLIQQLLPIGLQAVEEALQEEVTDLAGLRYSRRGSIKRWGSNPGSVFLGNQKLSIRVPRLRDVEENEEVELESYNQLQSPQIVDDRVFVQVLNRISTRKYEKAVEKISTNKGIDSI